jgi:hypothetical protein
MATTKVSALSALTTTDGAEELLINDGGTSKKVTIANLLHDNSIDSDHYVDGSIDNAHLADDAVGVAELSATGTASSSTFLRGDNSWVTPTDTNTTYTVGDGGLTQINFTSADNTKLDGIEASADVTDATNVAAAGALMDSELAGLAAVKATTGTFLTADQTKLDAIEASADVTDTTNVTAAGALMDSEVTNLAAVKAFATSDYATAAQGTTADAALPKAGGAMTGAITTNSTFDGVDIATRDGVLTSTTTTANAALPKAGGTMTGTAVASTNTDATNTGSVTLDFATNQNFVLTLTGNVTLANPTTETVGQSGFIACIQDGTGSRTLSLGTDYETAAGAGITLTSTASATDLVPYLVVAANRILLGTPQLAFA